MYTRIYCILITHFGTSVVWIFAADNHRVICCDDEARLAEKTEYLTTNNQRASQITATIKLEYKT